MIDGIASLAGWLGGLLPVIAAALAVLLVAASVAAVRQLRAVASISGGSAATGAAGAAPGTDGAQATVAAARRLAARLSALTGSPQAIDAIPLLVVVGADSADVQRMIPDLARAPVTSGVRNRSFFAAIAGCRYVPMVPSSASTTVCWEVTGGRCAGPRWSTSFSGHAASDRSMAW